MIRPKVYIAGPFFNPQQTNLIGTLEAKLASNNFPFYSPRIHSGSADLTPEQRKTRSAWESVFKSNVTELERCGVMIAVLDYLLPAGQSLELIKRTASLDLNPEPVTETIAVVNQPDLGTVWEMGAMRIGYHSKPIIGFTSREGDAGKMNLMLAHGVHAIVRGYDNLSSFLHLDQESSSLPPEGRWHLNNWGWFNWDACEQFEDEIE